jgi:hypothetical protein
MMFVLIPALLFLHLPTQSPSMIVSNMPARWIFLFPLIACLSLQPKKKLNYGYLLFGLRAVEYTETVRGGFQAHRFQVPCITLDA